LRIFCLFFKEYDQSVRKATDYKRFLEQSAQKSHWGRFAGIFERLQWRQKDDEVSPTCRKIEQTIKTRHRTKKYDQRYLQKRISKSDETHEPSVRLLYFWRNNVSKVKQNLLQETDVAIKHVTGPESHDDKISRSGKIFFANFFGVDILSSTITVHKHKPQQQSINYEIRTSERVAWPCYDCKFKPVHQAPFDI